jgi:hypothetical protein
MTNQPNNNSMWSLFPPPGMGPSPFMHPALSQPNAPLNFDSSPSSQSIFPPQAKEKKETVIKAFYKEEIRRIIIEDITFPKLKQRVCEIFNLDVNNVSIKYKDEEEDIISLDSEEELADALRLVESSNLLRVYLYNLKGSFPQASPKAPNLAQSFPDNYHHQMNVSRQSQSQSYSFGPTVPLASLPLASSPQMLDKKQLKEQWRNEKKALKQQGVNSKEELKQRKKEQKRDWKLRKDEFKAQKELFRLNHRLAAAGLSPNPDPSPTPGPTPSPNPGLYQPPHHRHHHHHRPNHHRHHHHQQSGSLEQTQHSYPHAHAHAHAQHFSEGQKAQDQTNQALRMQQRQIRLQSRPLYARFVKHVTVPDGTEFAANETFVKTWRFRNEGAMAWPPECSLMFISKLTGDQMSAPDFTPVGSLVNPGAEVDISVGMIAPPKPGHYQAYFRLSYGPKKFGQRVWVKINVAEENVKKNVSSPSHLPLPSPLPLRSPSPLPSPSPLVPLAAAVMVAPSPSVLPMPSSFLIPPMTSPSSPSSPSPSPSSHEEEAMIISSGQSSAVVVAMDTATNRVVNRNNNNNSNNNNNNNYNNYNNYNAYNNNYQELLLRQLEELGFHDRALNMRLIEKHKGDLNAVVRELFGM